MCYKRTSLSLHNYWIYLIRFIGLVPKRQRKDNLDSFFKQKWSSISREKTSIVFLFFDFQNNIMNCDMLNTNKNTLILYSNMCFKIYLKIGWDNIEVWVSLAIREELTHLRNWDYKFSSKLLFSRVICSLVFQVFWSVRS